MVFSGAPTQVNLVDVFLPGAAGEETPPPEDSWFGRQLVFRYRFYCSSSSEDDGSMIFARKLLQSSPKKEGLNQVACRGKIPHFFVWITAV